MTSKSTGCKITIGVCATFGLVFMVVGIVLAVAIPSAVKDPGKVTWGRKPGEGDGSNYRSFINGPHEKPTHKKRPPIKPTHIKIKKLYIYTRPPRIHSTHPPMNLFKLTDPKALCLDGSPGAYYLRIVNGSRDWTFYFEGGGWCYDEQDCYGRSNGSLGSSKAYPTTMADTFQGLLSRNNETNYFANYNLIVMKYCDGNSFSGDRADSMTVNNRSLYFRGKAIRESVLTQVLATTTLGEAERVVLTGCSAGGLSTFLHSDSVGRWVADNLKSVTSFVAIPICLGFFSWRRMYLESPFMSPRCAPSLPFPMRRLDLTLHAWKLFQARTPGNVISQSFPMHTHRFVPL